MLFQIRKINLTDIHSNYSIKIYKNMTKLREMIQKLHKNY